MNYISPVFVLPEFQNKGIGRRAIDTVFELYPDTILWKLDTIQQEAGNCHLYESCGFVKNGKKCIVNENMTLIDYEKSNITIRPFEDSDAEGVSNLIVRNFVLLEFHGQGLGRKIMETVETDEFFTRAERVEIPASITAVGFYRKFWYN